MGTVGLFREINLVAHKGPTKVRDPQTEHRSSVCFERDLGVSHLAGAKKGPWMRSKCAPKATESGPVGPRLTSA